MCIWLVVRDACSCYIWFGVVSLRVVVVWRMHCVVFILHIDSCGVGLLFGFLGWVVIGLFAGYGLC